MCFGLGSKDTPVREPRTPLARRATDLSVIHNSNPKRSSSSPTNSNTEQPKDDASIIRSFSLIVNSIIDHVFNYYISPSSGIEKLSQFGRSQKVTWLLQAPKSSLEEEPTQVIAIRTIIGYEIFKAIRDDDFIPPAPKSLLAKKQAPADPKWRLEYFQSLSNTQQYFQYREKAIDKLTNNIMKLTQQLTASTDKTQEQAREKSLRSIVENAAEFTLTIGKQKPSFEIIYPQLPMSKATGSSAMARSKTSRSSSKKAKMENSDVPVLVPELRKYGDERGMGYDRYLTLVPVQKLPEGF